VWRRLVGVSTTAWEAIFMLLVLKIPMVYLGVVVWWSIRAVPQADTGSDEVGVLAPLTPCGWNAWKRRRPRGGVPRPFGRPARRAARSRTASAHHPVS
jgi:hypothetical protein